MWRAETRNNFTAVSSAALQRGPECAEKIANLRMYSAKFVHRRQERRTGRVRGMQHSAGVCSCRSPALLTHCTLCSCQDICKLHSTETKKVKAENVFFSVCTLGNSHSRNIGFEKILQKANSKMILLAPISFSRIPKYLAVSMPLSPPRLSTGSIYPPQ